MNTNIEVLRELDELVEAARLLGATQAKKGFGCYTDEDRRFERAMYESIDKHRAALLDWEAKQPAPQQPAAVDEAMVEAVARAICVACEENPDRQGDARGNEFRWQDYRDTALAAISAFTAAQQPAEGEEIMVNAAHGVFILPLQPSGLDGSGPRFVVHVPPPEQPAAAQQGQAVAECHCATCTCAPGMTPAVRFDTSPAAQEGAIRDHLIALGWTPPEAQQPAAVDEAAAIRAFEEHFQASADDPYFEGELELWLTAWRKALAAQPGGAE